MVVKAFLRQKGHQDQDMVYLRRVLAEVEHEGYKVEYFDPDTPKGADVAEVYDVVAPSVLILRDNGAEIFSWRGIVPKNPGDIRYFLGQGIAKISPTKISVTIPRPTLLSSRSRASARDKLQRGSRSPVKPGMTKRDKKAAEAYTLKRERTTIKRKKSK